MNEKTEDGFVEYAFKKWHFWIIVVVWSFWAGLEDLINIGISSFLGIFFATIFLVSLGYGIFYFIQISILKNIKKEIKIHMKNNQKG